MPVKGATESGWMSGRWLAHMLGRLMIMPSEALLRSAAKLTLQVKVEKGRLMTLTEGHTANVKVKPLSDRQWRAVIEQVAAHPDAAYRLISGQFGPELEEAFAAAGAALFPDVSGTGAFRCTCRERNVCKHICGLLVTAAGHFEENPYLWLEALGRPRSGLLAAVQARMADAQPAVVSDVAATPDTVAPGGSASDGSTADILTKEHFWETETDPDDIPVRPGGAEGAAPDSLLRRLGPLPLPREQAAVDVMVTKSGTGRGESYPMLVRTSRPLDEVLRGYVRYIGEAAGALAGGDLPPRYTAEPLPGKAVHVADRLMAEVEEALRQEGAALGLEQLVSRCPTAAALPDNLGRMALQELLDRLPDDLVVLAGRYAGPRDAVLASAAFRHVVTFDEACLGRLKMDADWARALAAAGAPLVAPVVLTSPQVGDEVWLTVTDPAGPVLEPRLIRRTEHALGVDPQAKAAAQSLLRHLTATGRGAVSEPDAVAVLLAEGHYTFRPHQDAAWLLPFQVKGLAPDSAGRRFTRDTRPWQPAFGRRPAASWSQQEDALDFYARTLAQRGAARQAVQEALQCVRWWCSVWGGPQARPATPPDVGALLEFLWITAPHQAARHAVAPEVVPGALGGWFAALAAADPDGAEAYGEHIAACKLADAYAHRLQTLPPAGAPDDDMLAWIVEGYRWIGAGRCWGPDLLK